MSSVQILRVALDVPLNRLFDYVHDDAHGGARAQIGTRVVVPFSGRHLVGVVVEISATSDIEQSKLKPVIQVFDDVVLDAQSFKLLKFCAEYYHYPLGQTCMAALPARLRQVKPAVSRKSFIYALDEAFDIAQLPKRQVVLQRVATALRAQGPMSQHALAEISPAWRKAIAQLQSSGAVRQTEVIAVRPSLKATQAPPSLNAEQQEAIDAVMATSTQFKPWLLYGITGSGKTEVYIGLLQQILAQPNTQALVLVPEINLTPQLEARFRNRLSQFSLVTLHSNLSESERLQNWLAAASGGARIVIGTRLSVLTPMPHLRMIVIDEEHDGSYKQQDGMRYHARDVAVMRAKQCNIPIVMGSATPSLETWHLAQKQQYGKITLTERGVKAAQLPHIRYIDTTKTPPEEGISRPLRQAIAQRLAAGEQTLLFLNRRGYAPVLHCSACQWVSACTRCSARLVVHLSQKRLKCHHCGHEQKIPLQCPSCGNPDLRPVGQATQRLEATLKQYFPQARIARVDRDSIRQKDALTHLLGQVQNKEIDILVGTQMLAKGHDFPHITLVGVIDTDSALFSPDFRASERLFAQLMQVAGRAGRGEKAGEVCIQTAFPHHALFEALRRHDFVSYAQQLLQERQAMHFPPLSYFALIRAEAAAFAQVQDFLIEAANRARQLTQEVMIYDLVRPQMERLKGLERGQLLMHAESRQSLQRLLKVLIPQLRADSKFNKIRWMLDIDPLEF